MSLFCEEGKIFSVLLASSGTAVEGRIPALAPDLRLHIVAQTEAAGEAERGVRHSFFLQSALFPSHMFGGMRCEYG